MNLATQVLIEQAQQLEEHRRLDSPGAQATVRMLRAAEPMVVTREVTGVIADASLTHPDWPLRPETVMVPAAYASFRGGAGLANPIGSRSLAAICWAPTVDHLGVRDGLAVTFFWHGGMGPDAVLQRFWHWDEARADVRCREATEVSTFNGAAVSEVPEAWGECSELGAALFQTFLRFIQQRIVVLARERPERAATTVAERVELPVRDVAIVTLRRPAARATDSDPARLIDWSHRWWVSGHWRQQVYGPGRTEHRPVWISPYLKGPEDRPVRPKPIRVFQVVR